MSELLLFKNRRPGETTFLDGFRRTGGYQGLEKALKSMTPLEVREAVKASGLRGRGGAGFPTGAKWSFFPADAPGVKYLVCNGDEMEPGTYKDRELLRADPHQLVEGMILGAYALQTGVGYIFIRYAYEECARNLERAIAEATAAGYLGQNILGSGFSFELHVHRSAGRYICGEETALLNGLEGRRPNPRSKPPFPAQRGLFGRPTTVNNVETLAAVPHIITGGPEWFKACLPGGASTPYLTASHLDVPLDFGPLEQAGTRFGTGGVTVFDETTCMVAVTLNLQRFFARESCGWCTPCRDGLYFVVWLLEKIERGEGTMDDLDTLRDQLRNITGSSFCALAQGAVGPLEALLRLFGDEVEEHIRRGKGPFQ